MSCKLCKSHKATLLEIGEPASKVGYNVICETCGLIYHHPSMSAEDMKRFYAEDYNGEYSASETIGRDLARDRILFLKEKINLNRIIAALEIGCAQGEFISELNLAGVPAEGIEPSKTMAEVGRKAYGVNITDRAYDDVPLRIAYYDLICMFHVLEHLPDPLGALKRIKTELKPDGHLFLEVPTLGDCQLAIIFKTIHPTTFVLETLSAMLIMAGFKIINITEKGYHLQALAKPAQNPEKSTYPNAKEIKTRVEKYLATRRKIIKDILTNMNRLIDKNQGAVYGAGLNTLDLDQVFPLSQLNLNAIFDADPRKQGKSMLGLPINSPEALDEWKGDYIIISSFAFQNEILHNLKFIEKRGVELVTLYKKMNHE